MRHPEPTLTRRTGWVLVALVMTRYEGWLVAAGLLAVAGLQRGRRLPRQFISLALYPAAAIAIYVTLAVAATGTWFLRADFFVPDNPSRGRPLAVVDGISQSLQKLAGPLVTGLAAAGALALGVRGVLGRSVAPLLPLALGSTALLPFLAFLQGHPHRDRYMVPLVAAAGPVAALALTLLPARLRGVAAAALLAGALWFTPPLAADAPMIVEAQWEAPFRAGRHAVSAAIAARYDGTPILASMGSLAHYMQDASALGLSLRDFLHEGNGDLWSAALASPSRYVRWILIERQAEGGDMLAALARNRQDFLSGFTPVADGGGLALYERSTGPESPAPAR